MESIDNKERPADAGRSDDDKACKGPGGDSAGITAAAGCGRAGTKVPGADGDIAQGLENTTDAGDTGAGDGNAGMKTPGAAGEGCAADAQGAQDVDDGGAGDGHAGTDMPEARSDSRSEKRQLRGLYGRINISLKTLDRIIVVLLVLLVAAVLFAISKPGFTVTFDSQGGTAVESQTRMHGELIEEPDEPTREGCSFDGWYLDRNCTYKWDMENDTVNETLTLYAGWK